jgi:hypothetical protein
MKNSITALFAIGLLVATPVRGEDTATKELQVLTKTFVIPRIDYKDTYGIEVIEFLRLKVWTASFLDRTFKPAHEYRCNPERLFTKITFKRNNVELGAALTEVTKQLNITWKVEHGRIVFEDSPASKNDGDANKP